MTGSFLHPMARPAREQFITLTRGEGSLVWDTDGKEYIDGMGSLWYCAVGHGRQEIAEAIYRQAGTLAAYSTFDPFTNGPADDLADKLVELTPIPAARVFFCNSGSEAIDTAIKLARLHHVLGGHPERTLIISRIRGYHGTNLGGTSAQGIQMFRDGWGPLLPEVVQVPTDDVEALATLMAERSHEIAAVITEPVQGAGGVWEPEEGYLEALRRLCDRHGALLIFDEVITGFGRLGSWFAANHYGVTPDMTTFAKAVTSGYQPLGGVFVGRQVRDALESDPTYLLKTGYTYSGHPTACAAALANLAIIEREDLMGAAKRIGTRLGGGLRSLADDGIIGSARGVGGVWAAGLDESQDAMKFRDRMLQLGVITRAIGTHSLTFCPPLVTTDAQIDRIVDAIATAASE